MFRIIIAVLFIIVCYIWGDWKHWSKYYPTFLFFIIWDLVHNFIFYNYILWMYKGFVNHTLSTFIVAFIIYPCTVMLYLPYFPAKIWKQTAYISLWVLIYTTIEFTAFHTGNFIYEHGWSIFWSIGMNIVIFIMLRLHYKKPLITWPISIILALLVMIIFKIPFNLIK